MGENNNSGASLGRRQPGTPQCPPQRPSLLPSIPQTLCKVGHMAISALPPPPTPSRPAPRVLLCLRPLARARPPSVEDRKEAIPARARAPAEDRRKGPRKGAARGGAGRRTAAQRGHAARIPHPPASSPHPGALQRRKDLSTGAAPPLTKGNGGPNRDQKNEAEAVSSHGRTTQDGHTGNSTEGLLDPLAKQPAGASAGERRERALRAGGHHLASTPPALIYSPLCDSRDLPSPAPARSPASDRTQPQTARARLAW